MQNSSLVLSATVNVPAAIIKLSPEQKCFVSAARFAADIVGGSGNKARASAHKMAIQLLASGYTPEATIVRGIELRQEGLAFLSTVDDSHEVVYTVAK